MENPENRRTATVAFNLLYGAAVMARVNDLKSQGIPSPSTMGWLTPLAESRIQQLTLPPA
jgi:hypothetical protein